MRERRCDFIIPKAGKGADTLPSGARGSEHWLRSAADIDVVLGRRGDDARTLDTDRDKDIVRKSNCTVHRMVGTTQRGESRKIAIDICSGAATVPYGAAGDDRLVALRIEAKACIDARLSDSNDAGTWVSVAAGWNWFRCSGGALESPLTLIEICGAVGEIWAANNRRRLISLRSVVC